MILTARWIFPVGRPPLERGSVTVVGETIAAVEPWGTRTADVDLGNAAILPAFVNAHTHLDLCDAAGRCPPSPDFPAWLHRVIAHRRQQTRERLDEAIAVGIRQSLTFGVAALGDISAQGASWRPLRDSGLDAVVYREAIGIGDERADATFDAVRQWLASLDRGGRIVAGISPHAPYSVGRRLLRRIASPRTEDDLATVPIAVHLGETRAELDLLARREGPFVEFLQGLGVYDSDALTSDISEWLGGFASPATLAHGNYLDPEAVGRGRPRAVVYCPRTHAAFGHDPYPLRELLAQGATVALGTDSLASNPDLSVLAEARFVHERFPDVACDTVLRMATANGAKALADDIANRMGSLSVGRDATLVVVPLPNDDDRDPYRLLLESRFDPTRTMLRGEWREASEQRERPE